MNVIFGWVWKPIVQPLLDRIDESAQAQEEVRLAEAEVESIRQALQGLSIKPGSEAHFELKNEQKAAEKNLMKKMGELSDMMQNMSLHFPRSAKARLTEIDMDAYLKTPGEKRRRETSGSSPPESMSVLQVIIFYLFVIQNDEDWMKMKKNHRRRLRKVLFQFLLQQVR